MAMPKIFHLPSLLRRVLIILPVILIIFFSSLIVSKYLSAVGTAYLIKGVIVETRHISPSEKKTVSINKGEQIRTLSGSSARLSLKNGNTIWMNENTALSILNSYRLKLTYGEIFLECKKSQELLIIETSEMLTSVKDATLIIEKNKDITEAIVLNGSVTVSDRTHQSQAINPLEKVAAKQSSLTKLAITNEIYALKDRWGLSGISEVILKISSAEKVISENTQEKISKTTYPASSTEKTLMPPIIFSFTSSSQGWRFRGNYSSFDTAHFKWERGHLALSPAGSTNCFSTWESPRISVQRGKTYRVCWQISSSAKSSNLTPDIRLRIDQTGNWLFWLTYLFSSDDFAPAQSVSKNYCLVFSPQMAIPEDTVILKFDIFNRDATNDLTAWVYLNEVSMEEVNIIPVEAPLHTFNFASDTQGWKYAGKIEPYIEPMKREPPPGLGLSPAGSSNSYSYWLSPDIIVQKDKIYRARFRVSTSVSDPVEALDFNLRCLQPANHRSWITGTYFSNYSVYPIHNTPRDFDLIIFPQLASPTDKIQLAFDLLSFDNLKDTHSLIYLHEVELQEIQILPDSPQK